MKRPYVVERVDILYPLTYFLGYNMGRAETTTVFGQAQRMTLDEARIAVYALKIDYRDSVWSIIRTEE